MFEFEGEKNSNSTENMLFCGKPALRFTTGGAERRKRRLPVEVGRLAEAAGEEKSAKPPMRSELPPGQTQTQLYKQKRTKFLV